MKFSSLTLLALISSTSAFSTFHVNKVIKNERSNILPFPTLNMAESDGDKVEKPAPKPKKKSKKEQALEEIEESVRKAEERRLALEAELAAAEAERLRLIAEAEKAAKAPEPGSLDFGTAAGVLAGGLTTAAAARGALGARSEVQQEKRKQRELERAAAEAEAKRKAAQAARAESIKKNVSFYNSYFCHCLMTWKRRHTLVFITVLTCSRCAFEI